MGIIQRTKGQIAGFLPRDRPFTQADWALVEHVVSCWTNFAKTGDPGLGWKPYTPDAPDFMVFDLREDGAKDASAMGAPLPRRE